MAEDNSFIREVNEEIRQEKARALWGRYGPALIATAVILVLATGAWQIYTYWQDNKSSSIGNTLITATELASSGRIDEALAILKQVEDSNYGSYPILAQLREAGLVLEKGDKQGAVTLLDKIANNPQTPKALKDIAQIRAGYILVDTATFDDLNQRMTYFTSANNSMRLSAREILGLSAWKAGNISQAKIYFEQIINDSESAGSGIVARAQLMLGLINSRTESVKG